MLSWRTARRISGLSVAALLATSMLMPSTAHASGTEVDAGAPGTVAAPKPPPVKVASTKVPAVTPGGASKVVAELPQTSTSKFRMIGVTWSRTGLSSGVEVQVRTRTKGAWSSWTSLDVDGEEDGQPGTEPLWIGKADGVAARVTSKLGAPQDVRISTIDPGGDNEAATASGTSSGDPVDGVARTSTVATIDGSPTFTGKPTIITRSSWGASSGTPCDSPIAGDRTRGVVVHHTAGSNSYSKSDSKAIVRATQAYHMKGRNWCDIGYNFLVDKYGQIFEGRRGGMDRAVRAAHSGNAAVNTYDMGVSMMGNYDKVHPSSALESSMVKLIGWRMGTNYLKAKGTYSLGGLTLNMIAGHRNVVGTECPGGVGYAWLSENGGLRDRVEDYLSNYSSPVKSLYKSLGSSKTGAIFIGEADSSSGGRRLRAKLMDLYSTSATSAAHYTSSKIRTEHERLGGRGGALGYPKENPKAAVGATLQHFATGSVFAISGKSRAYSMVGDIAKTYARLGELTGKLGAPTSSTSTVRTGVTRVNFVKGWITSTASTGKTVAYSSDGKAISTTTPAPTTPPAASSANVVKVPSSRKLALTGHGYGHGIGMSQYGAQGAARQGVTYDKILSHYYPGTALGTKTGNIRVLISQDTTDSVLVAGRSGLVFRNVAAGKTLKLPTTVSGKTVTRWQIVQVTSNKTQSTLQYRTTGGYATYKGLRWTGDGQFEGPSKISLIMPGGSAVAYRGVIRSAVPSKGSTSRNTVDILPIEHYVRGVISAEMPSSWLPEALKAQAVAARTYGVRSISSSRYYDICSTTACQVYGGAARETTNTNAAAKATAGKILTYAGKPALAQFSSSSGGYTAPGSQPYLKAVSDPYDNWSGNANHTWTTTLTAAAIEKAYPSIGTLKIVKITRRTDGGDWGGRVGRMSLVGSKTTVSITGESARWAFGLKSTWFRV